MSAGNVIVQIRRKQGRLDFIPAYSTAELLHGVCHVTHFPKQELMPEGNEYELDKIFRYTGWSGNATKQRQSREKFEANKEEIYTLLAQGRGVKVVATQFRIGYEALQRYLGEAQ